MSSGTSRPASIGQLKVAALAAIFVLLLIAFATQAVAHSGDDKHAGKCSPKGKGTFAGTMLTTYWDTAEVSSKNGSGAGDNIVRVVNPNGCANPTFCGTPLSYMCAMVYVFDDTGVMGECCGCPVGAQTFLSLSLEKDLRSNWFDPALPIPNSGLIDIVSAQPNAPFSCSTAHACNFGCDPTNMPGYIPDRGLKGYILHNQVLAAGAAGLPNPGIPEVPLETANPEENSETLPYLQGQCEAIVGNSGGHAICDCGAGGTFAGSAKAGGTK